MVKHGRSVLNAMLEDAGNIGETLTIVFSNGSTGLYERSDSAFNGSHGFFEIKSPSCG